VGKSNFAETGFYFFLHHPKFVIPTGGTALFCRTGVEESLFNFKSQDLETESQAPHAHK
jgi:hypothetical protein